MGIRVGRGRGRRGRPVANADLREEIRNLRERLESLETGRNHEHTGDTSDEEVPEEEEETTTENPEVKILNQSLVQVQVQRLMYHSIMGAWVQRN